MHSTASFFRKAVLLQNGSAQPNQRAARDLTGVRAGAGHSGGILREAQKLAADNTAGDFAELRGAILHALIQSGLRFLVGGVTVTVQHTEGQRHRAHGAAHFALAAHAAAHRAGNAGRKVKIHAVEIGKSEINRLRTVVAGFMQFHGLFGAGERMEIFQSDFHSGIFFLWFFKKSIAQAGE